MPGGLAARACGRSFGLCIRYFISRQRVAGRLERRIGREREPIAALGLSAVPLPRRDDTEVELRAAHLISELDHRLELRARPGRAFPSRMAAPARFACARGSLPLISTARVKRRRRFRPLSARCW